jgi:hypothetical protein
MLVKIEKNKYNIKKKELIMKTFPIYLDEKEFLELDILLTLSKEKNKQKLLLSILREAIEKKREDIDVIKELMEKNNVG